MIRVVTSGFVTLDRVSEDPGGVEDSPIGGWAFGYERGPEGDRYKPSMISDGWGATAFIALDRNGATATSNEVT